MGWGGGLKKYFPKPLPPPPSLNNDDHLKTPKYACGLFFLSSVQEGGSFVWH